MSNIDIHSHLLPGVDDGCQTFDETHEILDMMKEAGTEKVYLTPHLYSRRAKADIETVKKVYDELRGTVEGVELVLGSEISLRPEILSSPLLTLGDTNMVLLELPIQGEPPNMFEMLGALQERGYAIILAHIERFPYLFEKRSFFGSKNSPSAKLKRLKEMGVMFQVNWGSLFDKKKQKLLKNLISDGYVDFTGSDKHSLTDDRRLIDFSSHEYSLFQNTDFL